MINYVVEDLNVIEIVPVLAARFQGRQQGSGFGLSSLHSFFVPVAGENSEPCILNFLWVFGLPFSTNLGPSRDLICYRLALWLGINLALAGRKLALWSLQRLEQDKDAQPGWNIQAMERLGIGSTRFSCQTL